MSDADSHAMSELPTPTGLYGSDSASFHVATLLALLRAGKQSAARALNRIAHRLSPGERKLASPRLLALIFDQQRHNDELAAYCVALPHVVIRDPTTRSFFRGLESRESTVHLARVAALDACVCQVLTGVLARATQQQLGKSLMDLLSQIRVDGARHVHATRDLARIFGASTTLLRVVNAEICHNFIPLLGARAQAFAALGIDYRNLLTCVRRAC